MRAVGLAAAKTIAALAAATDRPTYFVPLASDGNRLCLANEPAHCKRLLDCALLLAIQANQGALSGDWLAAYGWNDRIYRISSHLYQQPTVMRMLGTGIEKLATNQTLQLPQPACPPIQSRCSRTCHSRNRDSYPEEIIARIKSLVTLDYIEAFFEWAADPPNNPEIGKIIAFMIDPSTLMPKALPRSNPPFATVAEFRAALLKSSVDSAWQARFGTQRHLPRWEATPFAQAWRNVKQFRAALAAIGDRAAHSKGVRCVLRARH